MSDLASFLLTHDFVRIPLFRSGVGHFHARGALAGRDVTILVDTGASSTLVSAALARELGLELRPIDIQGAGAGGGNLEIFAVEAATLRMRELEPRTRGLFAMDLTHVNVSLMQRGESPVEAILGADVFENHEAVIDYGSSSLFLR